MRRQRAWKHGLTELDNELTSKRPRSWKNPAQSSKGLPPTEQEAGVPPKQARAWKGSPLPHLQGSKVSGRTVSGPGPTRLAVQQQARAWKDAPATLPEPKHLKRAWKGSPGPDHQQELHACKGSPGLDPQQGTPRRAWKGRLEPLRPRGKNVEVSSPSSTPQAATPKRVARRRLDRNTLKLAAGLQQKASLNKYEIFP